MLLLIIIDRYQVKQLTGTIHAGIFVNLKQKLTTNSIVVNLLYRNKNINLTENLQTTKYAKTALTHDRPTIHCSNRSIKSSLFNIDTQIKFSSSSSSLVFRCSVIWLITSTLKSFKKKNYYWLLL